MDDHTKPFQDQLAKRLIRRAAELRAKTERLADMPIVFEVRAPASRPRSA
jgi:hypothetical protein